MSKISEIKEAVKARVIMENGIKLERDQVLRMLESATSAATIPAAAELTAGALTRHNMMGGGMNAQGHHAEEPGQRYNTPLEPRR